MLDCETLFDVLFEMACHPVGGNVPSKPSDIPVGVVVVVITSEKVSDTTRLSSVYDKFGVALACLKNNPLNPTQNRTGIFCPEKTGQFWANYALSTAAENRDIS